MSAPRFLVPDAHDAGPLVALSGDEAHHARHVLRLGVDASLVAFDGLGHEWNARVTRVEKRGVTIELLDARETLPEPSVRVTLAVGVLKGEQMDAVVRDATALGVAEIVPLLSDHVTVASSAWKKGTPAERWRRVAVAAAKQCGRAVVPQIVSPESLEELFSRADAGARVMGVEPAMPAGDTAAVSTVARPRSALVLVGPEGGWASREVDLARRHGTVLVTLGPRRLTAALAPIALLSALRTVWGW